MNRIRVLVIAEYADRSETGMFIGLYKSGIDLNVILNGHSRYIQRIKEATVTYQLIKKS